MSKDIVQLAEMLNLPSVQDYLDVLRADCGSSPPPQFSSDVMLPLLDYVEALKEEVAALKAEAKEMREHIADVEKGSECLADELEKAEAQASRMRSVLVHYEQ